jgi:two-component system chemotaxis response regulator CheY
LINPLKAYRILVVDADIELAQVLKAMLREMGFSNVHLTKSGVDAISLMRTMVFDFIITEWATQQLDGIAMLEFIRRNPNSPNPTIPIIMLTGRAEQVDVALARDYGINEYVIKPFTAKSIYSRLERIVEQPRSFVVAKTFVGPDRRSREKPQEEDKERRVQKTLPKLKPKEVLKALYDDSDEPKIWLPDFTLRLKLGKNMNLNDFITPEVLEQSQAAINSITNSSLHWIRNNLHELQLMYETMLSSNPPPSIASDISDIALTINSRAGTFGYSRAGEIAYTLYLFSRTKLNPQNTNHAIIIKKHIDVLNIFLGNQMSGDAGAIGLQIATELKTLISKYSKN